MTLLRIGRTLINLDQVTCFRDLCTRDASGQVTQAFYRVEFIQGEAIEIADGAAALHDWLNGQVVANLS